MLLDSFDYLWELGKFTIHAPLITFITSQTRFLIIALLLIANAFTIQVFAQLYPARIYTEADGLANSTVNSIAQDSTGILWIARRAGLSSYNGTEFKNYGVSDGVQPISYAFLKVDELGKVWAFPEYGQPFVSYYENRVWKTLSCKKSPAFQGYLIYESFDVFYNNKQVCFVAGTDNEGVLLFENGLWRRYTMKNGLPSNLVYGVAYYDGRIFAGTDKGLSEMDKSGAFKNASVRGKLPSDYIIALAADGKKLWILGETWLGCIQDRQFTVVSSGFRIKDSRLGYRSYIYKSRNDKLIFGNASCVFYYSIPDGGLESLGRHNGLVSEGGTSAIIDVEGNLWITGLRGITKISSQRFMNYFESDGLASNEVASGLEISPGKYVFGHEGFLTFFDGKKFTRKDFRSEISKPGFNARVLELKKDAANNLWIAANILGLGKISPDSRITWYHEKEGLLGTVYSVDILNDGTVYCGTTKGFFRFREGRFEMIPLTGLKNMSMRRIFHDPEGTMYFATFSEGLAKWENARITEYKSKSNLKANNVFGFYVDSHKRAWVGTAAGLYIISGDSLAKCSEHDLVINSPVYLILEDQPGRLWFGTDNGLYRWDGKTMEHYTVADGLSGQEMNRSACFMDSSHNLWFGTSSGLTVFRPQYDYNLKQVPGPNLSFLFMAAGKDTFNLSSPVNLPYDQNNLVFHFRAISYINEKQIFYKYKLEGIDTSWSAELNIRDNRFDFLSLRPGHYRFCVKARNSLGIWSETLRSPLITINKPIWLRWWFLAIIILIVTTIAFFSIRYIWASKYRKQLEEMVAKRTSELEHSEFLLRESNQAKDNFFSIIAHDLRSPFNVLLGMLELLTTDYNEYSDKERQMMLGRLRNASLRTFELLDNLLTWAREQKGLLPFKQEKIDMHEILAYNIIVVESAAQSKDIIIKLNGENHLLAYADRNMINTVIRNLLSNAVKFSFPGGQVVIDLSVYDASTIQVAIKDKGFGMSPETLGKLFQIENRMVTKGTNNEIGTGLGLILCKDFLTRNKGMIRVESEEGTGSTFYFTLPSAEPIASL